MLDAFACLALPATALHATLTGVGKTQQKLLQISCATLAASALASLVASTLGALLTVALQSVVPSSAALTQVWGLMEGASVSFGCPSAVNGSVALLDDGSLVCAENATAFAIDDVARTFVADATTRAASVAEQVVTVAEGVFPQSLAQAFVDGNVLSLVVGGLMLGVALTAIASESEAGRGEKNFVILQVVAHAEAVLCRGLSWLQKYLPVSVAFIISSVLLHSSSSASSDRDDGTVAVALALMAVLLLALVVDMVVMICLAAVFTRSNPFAFLEHLLPAQLLALSSGSSLVSLPATISSVVASKQVSPPLAFIVCAASTVLNQTGTAVYLSVSSLFVLAASAADDELISASTIASMVFVNALIAGVVSTLPTGSKTAALATILAGVFGVSSGPRAVLLAFLAALEWITGPFVSCVNVTNNALVALVIAHYFETRPEPVTQEVHPPESSAPIRDAPVPDLHQQRVMGVIHSENWV
ncbi:Dicarboxylate/amino acid:cation (Na or H) symporter protein [Phytophthora megakarya]|uniref:Amino acid transporter n=1 Tax=Phytophthora megakarya TaxID=4795 RepID=A0A225WSG3_9STRA|nr:Dicarboxylate/amino acid:cation (Na or H) symporter protein [Phytophthora megakarya]